MKRNSITAPVITESDADQTVSFTVTLDAAVEGGFAVAHSLTLDTAEGTDLSILTPSPISFAGTTGETQSITVTIIGDEIVKNRFAGAAVASDWLGAGLLPITFWAIFYAGFIVIVKRLYSPTRGEMVQSLVILLFVSLVVLTVTGISGPSDGSVVINSDGTVTYTPDPNFDGTDSFTYIASDGYDTSNLATVHITVFPVNDPPNAVEEAVV